MTAGAWGGALGLFGAVDAVAGVAEAGEDVTFVVELAVKGSGEDGDVGVGLVQGGDAFGGGDEAEKDEVAHSFFAQAVDGGDGAASGGEHGVGKDDLALLDSGGSLQ